MITVKTPRNPGGYVAYYRVSTIRQGESGLGLEAQRGAVAHYLAGVKDNTLVAEFTEIESGKKATNRPQLAAAMAACKREHATLLIAKLDRLARSVFFIAGLMEAATDFVAVDMPAANKLTLHIMAAMAEHEREMISARTKAGLAVVRKEIEEKGFRVSKTGRTCTKLGNPRWTECIQKARDARRSPAQIAGEVLSIIQAHRSEGKSFRAVAASLNAMGLHTPGGAQWYAHTVRLLLVNDRQLTLPTAQADDPIAA